MSPPTLFLSAARMEALSAFRSESPNAVSLNLSVDSAGLYPSTLHQLMSDARRDAGLKPLERDLERIQRFVTSEFVPGPHRLVSVHSCAQLGFFEAYALPHPFKSSISCGQALDIRPLTALNGQYYRFVVLLLGPQKARFVEVYMGQAVELDSFQADFSGIDDLGALASKASTVARERRFDRLILGASAEMESALIPLLESSLQKDLILEPVLGVDRPIDAVLERVMHNERQARRVRESVLVHRLLDEARRGGAVTGLEAVVSAIQQGCVSRVLVRDGYTKMGRSCPKCGHLSVDHRSCPWCFRSTETVFDLVSELIDRALDAGCEVFCVMHDSRFDGVCRIGAELKTPGSKPDRSSSSRALRVRFATKSGRPSPLRPQ